MAGNQGGLHGTASDGKIMIEQIQIRHARQTSLFKDGRLIVWFSCGAASAVALKMLAHMNPIAVYCDLSNDENKDNARFLLDVEKWTGIKILTIRSKKFQNCEQVWEERQYMSGPMGAPCTVEMKKVPRFDFQRADDTHVFGYTIDEMERLSDFESANIDMNLAWPLVQAKMTKDDCLQLITGGGIAVPVMYRLGFKNNNCIGCVKSTSVRYWNRIRKYFPEVFQRRCEQSRRIGCRLVRYKGVRIFLDELPPDADDNIEEDLSCGPHCAVPTV